jgi:hypothetical protein
VREGTRHGFGGYVFSQGLIADHARRDPVSDQQQPVERGHELWITWHSAPSTRINLSGG